MIRLRSSNTCRAISKNECITNKHNQIYIYIYMNIYIYTFNTQQ